MTLKGAGISVKVCPCMVRGAGVLYHVTAMLKLAMSLSILTACYLRLIFIQRHSSFPQYIYLKCF